MLIAQAFYAIEIFLDNFFMSYHLISLYDLYVAIILYVSYGDVVSNEYVVLSVQSNNTPFLYML